MESTQIQPQSLLELSKCKQEEIKRELGWWFSQTSAQWVTSEEQQQAAHTLVGWDHSRSNGVETGAPSSSCQQDPPVLSRSTELVPGYNQTNLIPNCNNKDSKHFYPHKHLRDVKDRIPFISPVFQDTELSQISALQISTWKKSGAEYKHQIIHIFLFTLLIYSWACIILLFNSPISFFGGEN